MEHQREPPFPDSTIYFREPTGGSSIMADRSIVAVILTGLAYLGPAA